MAFSSSFKLLAMALVLAVMLLMSSEIVEATPNFKLGRRALDGVGVPPSPSLPHTYGPWPGTGGYYYNSPTPPSP